MGNEKKRVLYRCEKCGKLWDRWNDDSGCLLFICQNKTYYTVEYPDYSDEDAELIEVVENKLFNILNFSYKFVIIRPIQWKNVNIHTVVDI